MKILTFGDTHGRDLWSKVVKDTSFDVCVFMGDYFDSFDLDVDTQINNFKKIVAFKKRSKNPVILLLGNHELHYLLPSQIYSGYNHLRAMDIFEVLSANEKDLQYAYQYDDLLFTHAGVTKTWAKRWEIDVLNPAQSINELPPTAFSFEPKGATSSSGDDIHQSCMWVRPQSLKKDALEGFVHIVGHTDVGGAQPYGEMIMLVDAIAHGEYLLIDDELMEVKKYEKSVRS